jgi:hypothetical protein
MREIEEMISCVLFLLSIMILVVIEDYILWRLWLIRYNSILLTTTPPINKQLNYDSASNPNYQSDKQSVNKEIIAEELNSRANKPPNKCDYRYGDKKQYYEPYRFFIGFRHISFLFRAYIALIIGRLKSGVNQDRREPKKDCS